MSRLRRWGPQAWSANQGDQPTAQGPHRLSFDMWRLPAGCLSQFQVLQPVAPSYKYKGRG